MADRRRYFAKRRKFSQKTADETVKIQPPNDQNADPTIITYLQDGFGRRVARKVGTLMNGTTLDKGYLYKDALNPIAELNADGEVVSRFVYATKSNVQSHKSAHYGDVDLDSSLAIKHTGEHGNTFLCKDKRRFASSASSA